EGTLNDAFINATAIIGEKIKLRRFEIVEKADDEVFGTYMHNGGMISALTVLKGGDAQVAKEMAMQVASMNPTYVSRNEMPQDVVAHEREIQEGIVANDASLANKPEKVKAGIVEGRVSKSLQDMCLVDQEFFLDTSIKCKQYLKDNNAEVLCFVKYTVGEGIEKKQDDFAAEVAAMAQK
ncbi:MAG: translation elongation factor Ts, partial [Solobacterium sp.]|nr:translation elongation factor Ts [Solobacterium sp.]